MCLSHLADIRVSYNYEIILHVLKLTMEADLHERSSSSLIWDKSDRTIY